MAENKEIGRNNYSPPFRLGIAVDHLSECCFWGTNPARVPVFRHQGVEIDAVSLQCYLGLFQPFRVSEGQPQYSKVQGRVKHFQIIFEHLWMYFPIITAPTPTLRGKAIAEQLLEDSSRQAKGMGAFQNGGFLLGVQIGRGRSR